MSPFPQLPPEMKRALFSVLLERQRQDQKWGEQNHAFPVWLAILSEEVGEMSQAFLKLNFGGKTPERSKNFREELVQVAAVALAMIECCDRNGWDR